MTETLNDGSPPTPEQPAPQGGKRYWIDQPRNITRIYWFLCTICALLVVSDFMYQKHPHFEVEKFPGFYGLYGFCAAIFIVFAGKLLRKIVMRDEDYYDR